MPKLTDRFLNSLTAGQGRKDRLVFDAVCPGLGVRVTARGSRIFIAQWTDPATKRKVREPLGAWGNLTVEQAREAVRVRLGLVAKGINPSLERARQKADAERERAETALTFDALVSDWVSLHLASRRARYRDEAPRAIRHTFAPLLKRPAARIGRAEVVTILDQLVRDGKATMAGRALAYARAAFRWAEKRGKIAGNPFQGLPIATAAVSRDRVLSDAEIAEVWIAVASMEYPWAPFFQIALLTLQRREEVAGMRWSEILPDLSLWTLPAERMKNAKPHDVYLSETAREILRNIPRLEGCDFVFSTTGKRPISGFSKAKIMLGEAMINVRAMRAKKTKTKPEPLSPWRLHDFRRTGVSTLARLGFDSIVADKLLAHQPTKLREVAAVYQRYDFATERARALDSWAAFVAQGSAISNVVQLVRAG